AKFEFSGRSGARDLNRGLTVPNHTTVHPNMSVSAVFSSILQVDASGASRFARIFSRITTSTTTWTVYRGRRGDTALRRFRWRSLCGVPRGARAWSEVDAGRAKA